MQTVFAEKQKTGRWMITDISGSFSLSGCTGKKGGFRLEIFCTGRMPKERMHRSISQEGGPRFFFDGLLLYLDETCEQNGVLLRKAQVRRCQKRRRYLETGNVPDMEQMKKSGHAAIFWLKVMGREFASFQGIVHIWGRDYPYRSGFELIILLKDIVGFTERRSVRKNWKAERN